MTKKENGTSKYGPERQKKGSLPLPVATMSAPASGSDNAPQDVISGNDL